VHREAKGDQFAPGRGNETKHMPSRVERQTTTEAGQFRQFLNLAPDAIVIVDHEGRIVFANAQVETLFGYRSAEILDRIVEILLPGRFRAVHVQHRADYLAAPRTRPMGIGLELAGRRKDGSEFPVEISLSPVQSANGICAMAVIRDITERKRLEAENERFLNQVVFERARVQAILEGAANAILYVDPVLAEHRGQRGRAGPLEDGAVLRLGSIDRGSAHVVASSRQTQTAGF
jgi:PAS domain S-box-containing protein